MSVIDTLVFDRTQADVDTVKHICRKIEKYGLSALTDAELTMWNGEMKGACDATTLNRIGQAIIYIRDAASEQGVSISVVGKHDWQIGEIPSVSEMSSLLSDLLAISNAYPSVEADLPTSFNNANYTTFNHIEHFLFDVYQVIRGDA